MTPFNLLILHFYIKLTLKHHPVFASYSKRGLKCFQGK